MCILLWHSVFTALVKSYLRFLFYRYHLPALVYLRCYTVQADISAQRPLPISVITLNANFLHRLLAIVSACYIRRFFLSMSRIKITTLLCYGNHK